MRISYKVGSDRFLGSRHTVVVVVMMVVAKSWL